MDLTCFGKQVLQNILFIYIHYSEYYLSCRTNVCEIRVLPIRDTRVSKTLCISVFSFIALSDLVTWDSATAPRQDAKYVRPNASKSNKKPPFF